MVLLWWREDDGDLVDALMDAMGPLADNGVIWVLTPKTGRDGHVEPSEIAEAVPTAGLSQTSNVERRRRTGRRRGWCRRSRRSPSAEPVAGLA